MQAFICVHQAAPLTLELLSLAWCPAAAAMWISAAPTPSQWRCFQETSQFYEAFSHAFGCVFGEDKRL